MENFAPRIYVASLSDYNAGRLHGVWIDCLGKDASEIEAEVQAMLAASEEPHAEEWAIHDHEGFLEMRVGENESFEAIAATVALIEEHGKAAAAFLENQGYGEVNEAAKEAFEEAYIGCYDSVTDYAEEYTRECHEIPSFLEYYVDWEKLGRDLELNGDIWSHEAGYHEVYIFRNI